MWYRVSRVPWVVLACQGFGKQVDTVNGPGQLGDAGHGSEEQEERQNFASGSEIQQHLGLERDILAVVRKRFPVRWPKSYLQLVKTGDDPIAKMGRPSIEELKQDPGDLEDPIGDVAMRPRPFIVRKHEDRVIVLTTRQCHFYCRFCFRRGDGMSRAQEPGPKEWEGIFAYLAGETDLREVILSGGDPLTLRDAHLFWIHQRLRAIAHIQRWRIHTRAPVHYPSRVTSTLVDSIAQGLPLRLILHFNHPSEVTTASVSACELLRRSGIQLGNQAVLLADVNDSAELQCRLWQHMAQIGLNPHYLHHPDRVQGNSSFRVRIKRGLEIYREMKASCEAPLPRYVLDLPDGSGKVPVEDLENQGHGRYTYRHDSGKIVVYADW